MDVDITTEIEIDRACADVALYAAHPDNAPDWYVNIKSVEWQTPKPLVVGSQIAFVAHFMGRRLAYTYEVIELSLPDRLVMRTADGPFLMETSYTWHAVGENRTQMTLRNRGKPEGFSRLMMPLMKRAMRKANRTDLACLKDFLEAGRDRA